MTTTMEISPSKQYYLNHKEQMCKNSYRCYYLKSMKNPDHMFYKSTTPEKLQTAMEEKNSIKMGRPIIYQSDVERKAAKTKVRNEITKRYLQKRKCFNDEMSRLFKIDI